MKNTNHEIIHPEKLTGHLLQRLKDRYIHLLNHKKGFLIKNELQALMEEFGITNDDLDMRVILNWHDSVVELAYIKPFLENDCHEVILHGHHEVQVITAQEKWSESIDIRPDDYQLGLESLAHGHNQEWSFNSPFVSFPCQLHGHDVRVTLVHACLTRDKTAKLYLRKVHQEISQLHHLGLEKELQDYLHSCVIERKNILICGPTGSGKTTLLKSMLNETPCEEHLLLMEDCAEIEIQRPSTTHLVSDASHKEKTLESFCSYAMRLRPDRIVLGEIRGREITPFLLAMNTGHKGLMATLHANSAVDCLSRLTNLFGLYSPHQYLSQENIVQLVCQNIDVIIYMNEREICEIIHLTGSEGNCPYYTREFAKAA